MPVTSFVRTEEDIELNKRSDTKTLSIIDGTGLELLVIKEQCVIFGGYMARNSLFLLFLVALVLFSSYERVEAQSKTITGTVTEVILQNRWTAIVVRVGAKTYGVQTEYIASAGDTKPRFPAPRKIGNIDKVGQRVRIIYTKVNKSFDWDGHIWLKATRIVALQ